MKRILLGMALLCWSFSALAFDGNFQAFEKRFLAIQSFETNFTQEYYLALEERSLNFQGIFSYKRPGLMRWVYAKPEPQEVIVGEKQIWIVDPVLETVTIQPVDEVKAMESLSFLFTNQSLTLKWKPTPTSGSKLSQGPGNNYYLAPKVPNPQVKELQIRVDPNLGLLYEFVVVDHQGNYRKILLSQIRLISLPKERFHYEIPPEMEIIDTMAP